MARSKQTAYALVDKDVTQDADLLIPDLPSPSYGVSANKNANQVSDVSEPGEDGAPEIKQNSPLLKLPVETKQMIWTMAVTCDDPITPFQVAPKSNKFLWNKAQVEDKTVTLGWLTAASLTSVCKQTYNDVSLTHLFYRHNEFDFTKYPRYLNTYILAITNERKHAISSMCIDWRISRHWSDNQECRSMAVLASCKGLSSLKISVFTAYARGVSFGHDLTKPELAFRRLPEYELTFAAMQGLKKLELNPIHSRFTSDDSHMTWINAACRIFKDDMAGTMASERTGEYNLRVFQQAQQYAALDIDGEGRLSDDKKPGIVSSRTRSKVARAKALVPNGNGVLPNRETPKYDLYGMLSWTIQKVLDCRKCASDDGLSGVQFKLQCQVNDSDIDAIVTFWEDASLIPGASRNSVLDFYEENPDKAGLSAVYNEWVYQGTVQDDADNFRGKYNHAWLEETLRSTERLMRQIARAEKAKAKADKAAAIQAKKAAAQAEKDVTQAKTVAVNAKAEAKPARRARGKKV